MCLLCLVHCHMVDFAIAVEDIIGGRCLVEAVVWLGTSTIEVSSLATIEAHPIRRVLHWPLSSLLSLHVPTSRVSSLESIGALDELSLWGLIALHCGLGSLLELGSRLLLRGTLDRSGKWYTYLRPGVVTTLTLVLFLLLAFHDTAVAFQYKCIVHHILEIPKVSGLQCIC
jgi:hypothetical protein